MKFRAHETFFIRKGWLSKGMKYVKQTDGTVFVDKENNPMDVLGIGSNMVKSLRYWLQAVGLTKEGTGNKRNQTFTELGERIYESDRYLEELGSLQLLHYNLATNEALATSWYIFFNEFTLNEFNQEDFSTCVKNYVSMNASDADQSSGTERTIGDDYNCIAGTYIPRYKMNPAKVSAESNIDCPFGELGLMDILNKKDGIYRKVIPDSRSFNPWVLLAMIKKEHAEKQEISLNDLLMMPRSIGKVFNLDSITLLELLRSIEKIGEAKIIRTAGLDVVRITHPDLQYMDCVNNYYLSF